MGAEDTDYLPAGEHISDEQAAEILAQFYGKDVRRAIDTKGFADGLARAREKLGPDAEIIDIAMSVIQELFPEEIVSHLEPGKIEAALGVVEGKTLSDASAVLPHLTTQSSDAVREAMQPVRRGKPIVNTAPHFGRNDPCPCGCGKKFKVHFGRDDLAFAAWKKEQQENKNETT